MATLNCFCSKPIIPYSNCITVNPFTYIRTNYIGICNPFYTNLLECVFAIQNYRIALKRKVHYSSITIIIIIPAIIHTWRFLT